MNSIQPIPVKLVAKLLFVSPAAVYKWIERQQLPTTYLCDIEKFIKDRPRYAQRIEAFRNINQNQSQG
jgi:hypothetical protein